MLRIAVVGGGLFGCTAAIHASRDGHEVHLFEASKSLMQGATGRNYFRLHRGYHYPRSPETGRESLAAESFFRNEYGEAVVDRGTQLYGVVEGGHVTNAEYAAFLDRMGLPYTLTRSPHVAGEVFAVSEPRVDPVRLDVLVRERMNGVNVHLGRQLVSNTAKQFDAVIVAAYAGIGMALDAVNVWAGKYKFQVVEKPIVKMPKSFRDLSIVMIDGPFCCIDPHGSTDLHVLGHVTETVHSCNVGLAPQIPEHLREWLASPWPVRSEHSRFNRVVDAMSQFIPEVRKAEHVGSVLTIRAVLPDLERTDARPTLVDRVGDNVIRVFSGKLGTAVVAAKRVMAELHAMEKVAA